MSARYFKDNSKTPTMSPLNAKKVQIYEIMSGGFAVKNSTVRKKYPAVFGNFFTLLKFFAIFLAKS